MSTSPRASASPAQCVEVRRPAWRRGVDRESGEERQPVGQEARADDQHALVPQRSQPLAEASRRCGSGSAATSAAPGRRRRVHDLQRHPGAVVEPPAGVLVHRLGVGHHRRRPAGPARWPGVRVRHPEVLSANPPKSYTRGAPSALGQLTGADSQWALTMRIACGWAGLRPAGELADQSGSSNRGGAPWPR